MYKVVDPAIILAQIYSNDMHNDKCAMMIFAILSSKKLETTSVFSHRLLVKLILWYCCYIEYLQVIKRERERGIHT